jgi:hypothetical protein
VKLAFMVPHRELVAAWEAILRARGEGRDGDAEEAMALLGNLDGFSYDEVNGTLDAVLYPTGPARALETQRRLVHRFQGQYRRARAVAEGR